jgi:hypothetical protein
VLLLSPQTSPESLIKEEPYELLLANLTILKTQMALAIPVTELKYEFIIMPDYSTTNTKHYFSIF